MKFSLPASDETHIRQLAHLDRLWAANALPDDQKAKRVRHAQAMIEALDHHLRTGFTYWWTGGESWMTQDQTPTRMGALDRSYVDEKVSPTNCSPMTMITVFFGIDEITMLDVPPTETKITSDYFCRSIVEMLEQVPDPSGRISGATRYILHFDHTPVRQAAKLQQKFDDCRFHRFEQTPYSPDLAPCDLVLCDDRRDKIQFLSHRTVDELQEAITSTAEAISKTKLIYVFQTRRLQLVRSIQQERSYFE
jgi:hypothetical protein